MKSPLRCSVCGGATTCPQGRYKAVLAVQEEDILRLKPGEELPVGYTVTHYRKREVYALPLKKVVDGKEYRLELVGSAQRWRVQAHYGVLPVWVGMVTYAFWAIPAHPEEPLEEE